jgi:hypothetical protein
MNERFTEWRPLGKIWPVLAVFALALSGCDSILGSNQAAFAYEARVIVEGSSAVPLRLITSTNFATSRDPDTGELVAAQVVGDTAHLTGLPFDRVFEIRGADRFLVRLINPDINVTATIHLRVHLDDREVYNQRATMRDASLQYIAFYRP